MKILSIETSCDETSIAILEFSGTKHAPDTCPIPFMDRRKAPIFPVYKRCGVRVLSHIVSSQVKLHAKYGGVVPNLAKREHQRNLAPILLQALREARLRNPKSEARNTKQIQNSKTRTIEKILEREQELLMRFRKDILRIQAPEIDAIAVTIGPGLAPALWVGVNFARSLACFWDKPIIPVNHMMGHFFSSLVVPTKRNSKSEARNPKQIQNLKIQNSFEFRISDFGFPAIALLVSGGHTELILSKRWGKYEIIGETLDDAAGEAFDKVARILELGYPGGPAISREAEMALGVGSSELGVKLPRPMINSKNFNFSFSGLKTAALYLARDLTKKYPLKKIRPAIAKEFQNAVVDVLVSKTIRAAQEYRAKSILLGGGVAANALLRERLAQEIKPPTTYHLPPIFLTGDNAFMIGLAAYFSRKKRAPDIVGADANLSIP